MNFNFLIRAISFCLLAAFTSSSIVTPTDVAWIRSASPQPKSDLYLRALATANSEPKSELRQMLGLEIRTPEILFEKVYQVPKDWAAHPLRHTPIWMRLIGGMYLRHELVSFFNQIQSDFFSEPFIQENMIHMKGTTDDRPDQPILAFILRELLKNSVGAMEELEEDGFITVRLSRAAGGFRISVEDNGSGFDPKRFELIQKAWNWNDFQLMERFGRNDKLGMGGEGLLRVTVSNIIERGGQIAIETRNANGDPKRIEFQGTFGGLLAKRVLQPRVIVKEGNLKSHGTRVEILIPRAELRARRPLAGGLDRKPTISVPEVKMQRDIEGFNIPLLPNQKIFFAHEELDAIREHLRAHFGSYISKTDFASTMKAVLKVTAGGVQNIFKKIDLNNISDQMADKVRVRIEPPNDLVAYHIRFTGHLNHSLQLDEMQFIFERKHEKNDKGSWEGHLRAVTFHPANIRTAKDRIHPMEFVPRFEVKQPKKSNEPRNEITENSLFAQAVEQIVKFGFSESDKENVITEDIVLMRDGKYRVDGSDWGSIAPGTESMKALGILFNAIPKHRVETEVSGIIIRKGFLKAVLRRALSDLTNITSAHVHRSSYDVKREVLSFTKFKKDLLNEEQTNILSAIFDRIQGDRQKFVVLDLVPIVSEENPIRDIPTDFDIEFVKGSLDGLENWKSGHQETIVHKLEAALAGKGHTDSLGTYVPFDGGGGSGSIRIYFRSFPKVKKVVILSVQHVDRVERYRQSASQKLASLFHSPQIPASELESQADVQEFLKTLGVRFIKTNRSELRNKTRVDSLEVNRITLLVRRAYILMQSNSSGISSEIISKTKKIRDDIHTLQNRSFTNAISYLRQNGNPIAENLQNVIVDLLPDPTHKFNGNNIAGRAAIELMIARSIIQRIIKSSQISTNGKKSELRSKHTYQYKIPRVDFLSFISKLMDFNVSEESRMLVGRRLIETARDPKNKRVSVEVTVDGDRRSYLVRARWTKTTGKWNVFLMRARSSVVYQRNWQIIQQWQIDELTIPRETPSIFNLRAELRVSREVLLEMLERGEIEEAYQKIAAEDWESGEFGGQVSIFSSAQVPGIIIKIPHPQNKEDLEHLREEYLSAQDPKLNDVVPKTFVIEKNPKFIPDSDHQNAPFFIVQEMGRMLVDSTFGTLQVEPIRLQSLLTNGFFDLLRRLFEADYFFEDAFTLDQISLYFNRPDELRLIDIGGLKSMSHMKPKAKIAKTKLAIRQMGQYLKDHVDDSGELRKKLREKGKLFISELEGSLMASAKSELRKLPANSEILTAQFQALLPRSVELDVQERLRRSVQQGFAAVKGKNATMETAVRHVILNEVKDPRFVDSSPVAQNDSIHEGLMVGNGFISEGGIFAVPSLMKFFNTNFMVVIAPVGPDQISAEELHSVLEEGQEIVTVASYWDAKSILRARGFETAVAILSEDDPKSVVEQMARVIVFTHKQMSLLTAAIEQFADQFRSELRVAYSA